MHITSDWRKGFSKRLRAIEAAFSITITKTDRLPARKRLRAAETAAGLAGTGAARFRNNSLGFENRLKALEATEVP